MSEPLGPRPLRTQFTLRTLLGLQFIVAVLLSAGLALHEDYVGDVILTAGFAIVLVSTEIWTKALFKGMGVVAILAFWTAGLLHPDMKELSIACFCQGLVLSGGGVGMRLLRRQRSEWGWPLLAMTLLTACLVQALATSSSTGAIQRSVFGLVFGAVALAIMWAVFGRTARWRRLAVSASAVAAFACLGWALTRRSEMFLSVVLYAALAWTIAAAARSIGICIPRPTASADPPETRPRGKPSREGFR
jgi:hypothetical protein